ncbi:hypothetical protein Q1695_010482 [Nippostrongylus brasiliensis]|nr:hypothetical protein Q1695_010482 [Nippostrongylus brasiliensis]
MLHEKLNHSPHLISGTTCTGGNLTPGQRTVLLNMHNTVRRKIARGRANNYRGMLPGASNMYELNYDCTLEARAVQRNQRGCTDSIEYPARYGENVQTYVDPNIIALGVNEMSKDAVAQWYYPVIYFGQKDPQNRYTDTRLHTFVNLANYRNLKIGCDVATCVGRTIVRCYYDQTVPLNQIVYTTGTACTADNQCTTVAGSTCTNFLCQSTAGSLGFGNQVITLPPTMCPNRMMTDAVRRAALNLHNSYRSSTAQGKVMNGQTGLLPQAANMKKLTYNCALELRAIEAAKTCTLTGSTNLPATDAENYYVTVQNYNDTALMRMAVKDWFETILSNGINKIVHYRPALDAKPNAPKPFIRMVWAATTSMGCGMQYCPGNQKYIVCRYTPRSLIIGQYIYQTGAPCAACRTRCSTAEGLCT